MNLLIKIIRFAFFAILLSGCSSVRHFHDDSIKSTATKDYIKELVSKQESENGIPNGMLSAMAAVESQYRPHIINAKGKTYNFNSKERAIEFVKNFVNRKYTNFSIGCMQIHYKSHRSKFSSIDDMLTPESNISYAAKLLKNLYKRYGNWKKAIKFYHSANPKYNRGYYAKVMKEYNSMRSC